MADLCGDVMPVDITFDLVSYTPGNVANSDSVQHSDISENPITFVSIGTRISFSLTIGHNCDSANSTPFHIFTILPLYLLLSHCASYNDFADA